MDVQNSNGGGWSTVESEIKGLHPSGTSVDEPVGLIEAPADSVDKPTEPSAPAMFEGDVIAEMEGKLPAFVIDMPEGYLRGTHLRFNVEVRVKNVRYDENRKGELIRQHIFAIEEVALVAAFSPEQDNTRVGGSASASAMVPTPDEQAELGVNIGRTSDHWGHAISVDQATGEIAGGADEAPTGLDPVVGF